MMLLTPDPAHQHTLPLLHAVAEVPDALLTRPRQRIPEAG